MPISRWKTTSTHDATWSLRLWICALVVPFSGQKRLISPVGSSLIIQYPCADYTRGVVSLYGERNPGVLIPHWKMTPTSHAITETKMSSFWRNFNHWLHWKLSFWQLPVQPVMKISSKWRRFRFSDTVSSMVNVCIRYVIFWTKGEIFSQCEISPVGFITCNAISLCWLQRGGGGQIIIWWINSCCSFLMLYNGSHTLTWGVILLHNERTTAGSSYLTLKIDSYTTWNMISSIVNVHICCTILLAKRQSSVNTVYLKKYIVGTPLTSWLDDYGCICTYYLMALLNLIKWSYFIISGNNSQSAYRTLQNESHTLMGELFYDVQKWFREY